MHRFLSEVLMNTQGGGESLFGSIKIAVLPIAKVFTMCFLGFLMASKYINILPASGRKLLNGLVFSLLLPCLIFSQLGQAITFEKMIEWWFIPFNVVLATISGSLIGLIVALIVRPPYPYFKFTIIHIGIGNIGNVPLVLIAALCRDKSNPFGDSAKCVQDGNAYISFGQWVGAIVLYTYVFQMLAPPPGGSFDVIEQDKLPVKNTPKVNAPPEEVPLLTQEPEPVNEDLSKDGKIKQFLKYWYEKLKLKQIVQPPIIASILAIVIGCIPFLKQMIFTPDAPLYFFTDSCLILGTVEDDIIVDQVDSPEIVDDFEIGQDEAVDIKDKEVNKQKLKRRIDQYKIELRNPCRKGKKLLVLDIDYTLFDHRSTAENSLQLMRPYLHEFLTAAYAEYDIIIWSATSMKWVELKMGQLGVLSNPNYKITALLDHLAMITVQSDSRGIFDCKPLGLIWAHFPEFYSPKNTIMFDDLRRNFVMNPQNGLIIKPFRKAHENRDTDRELVKLTQYLLAIADLDDISVLDHKKWESYDEVSNIKRRRHT